MTQIVGSTLRDPASPASRPLELELGGGAEPQLVTNFESEVSSAEFADVYRRDGLYGGHVIMLGADVATQESAMQALRAFPGGSPRLGMPFQGFLMGGCQKWGEGGAHTKSINFGMNHSQGCRIIPYGG